jgi:mercuric ion transport protein
LEEIAMDLKRSGLWALLTGGLAAVLASTCCLGPLVLIALGFSGAWIANLTALEPYRPLFFALSGGALLLTWRRLRRPTAVCTPGQICAVPRVHRADWALFWLTAGLVGVALLFPFVHPLF